MIVQCKIHTCKEHENSNDPLDESAFVIGDVRILGTEASSGHGGKTVANCIEERHTAQD